MNSPTALVAIPLVTVLLKVTTVDHQAHMFGFLPDEAIPSFSGLGAGTVCAFVQPLVGNNGNISPCSLSQPLKLK